MRDQQHGGAGLAPQPQQFLAHQQTGLLIERAERLVEQDQPRLQHQCACDAHALAHAAGELRRIGIGEFAQAHEADGVIDAPRGLGRFEAGAAQAERDIVVHAEPRQRGVFLEHDADAVRHAGNRLALEDNRAFGRRRQPRQNIEQRGFAAAGGADHAEEFAAPDIEVDRAERTQLRTRGQIEGAGNAGQPGVNVIQRRGHSLPCRSLGK